MVLETETKIREGRLEEMLSTRLDRTRIMEIASWAQMAGHKEWIRRLYQMTLLEDARMSYQALWIITHFRKEGLWWISSEGLGQELMERVQGEPNEGKRRLMLTILSRLPKGTLPLSGRFLDFCLVKITSQTEAPGIRCLAAHLAYAMTRPYPELQREVEMALEMAETFPLPRSLSTVLKRIRRLGYGHKADPDFSVNLAEI